MGAARDHRDQVAGPAPISDTESGCLLAGIEHAAFHFETRPSYAISAERADYERFLAGDRPAPPGKDGWWQAWLDQVARLSAQGKKISRVRILDDPVTDYQRWLLHTGPWQHAAGEDIAYLPRERAGQLCLPLDHDWWLLDGELVTTAWFDGSGRVRERFRIAGPGPVAAYRHWRDVAAANAIPAEQIPAA